MTMYRQQLRKLKQQTQAEPPGQLPLRRLLGFIIFIAGCAILLGGLH
ncbi:hypothetical protein CH06BL_09220 [Chromobacterium haemolyticum]|nr:hypothetical protein CH06BL_09220 [Chromobacterium haemolyticum]